MAPELPRIGRLTETQPRSMCTAATTAGSHVIRNANFEGGRFKRGSLGPVSNLPIGALERYTCIRMTSSYAATTLFRIAIIV